MCSIMYREEAILAIFSETLHGNKQQGGQTGLFRFSCQDGWLVGGSIFMKNGCSCLLTASGDKGRGEGTCCCKVSCKGRMKLLKVATTTPTPQLILLSCPSDILHEIPGMNRGVLCCVVVGWADNLEKSQLFLLLLSISIPFFALLYLLFCLSLLHV